MDVVTASHVHQALTVMKSERQRSQILLQADFTSNEKQHHCCKSKNRVKTGLQIALTSVS